MILDNAKVWLATSFSWLISSITIETMEVVVGIIAGITAIAYTIHKWRDESKIKQLEAEIKRLKENNEN